MDGPLISVHDAILLASLLIPGAFVWARMEVGLKWAREWCKEHREDDQRHFERLEKDVRNLYRRVEGAPGLHEMHEE